MKLKNPKSKMTINYNNIHKFEYNFPQELINDPAFIDLETCAHGFQWLRDENDKKVGIATLITDLSQMNRYWQLARSYEQELTYILLLQDQTEHIFLAYCNS